MAIRLQRRDFAMHLPMSRSQGLCQEQLPRKGFRSYKARLHSHKHILPCTRMIFQIKHLQSAAVSGRNIFLLPVEIGKSVIVRGPQFIQSAKRNHYCVIKLLKLQNKACETCLIQTMVMGKIYRHTQEKCTLHWDRSVVYHSFYELFSINPLSTIAG